MIGKFNRTTIDMDAMSINEKSLKLLRDLYQHEELDPERVSQILGEFRVLTREKTLTKEVLDEKCLEKLVNYSTKCCIEAQKCLSNLILNYTYLRDGLIEPYICCMENHLDGILKSQSNNQENNSRIPLKTSEVLYYDFRIIFLLSALCPGSRAKIRDRLSDRILRGILKEAEDFSEENHLLVIESLKTLFNLTLDKEIDATLAAQLIKKLFVIAGTERDSTIILDDETKNDQLLVNLIHLLTNMPKQVYLELSDEDVNKILNHLSEQLKIFKPTNFRDTILPVLNVCANICKHNQAIRQRWFDEILGSGSEFEKRPEEYDTLRGRLVKLMTSIDVHIKDIAAEFLYALCGNDTEKFVTYTGFGNSVAFLSTRGLLTQGSTRASQDREAEISETEKQYQQLRDKLDPITGKIGVPKPNPMEGMSEEEKEWHAHELAGAIAKLSRLGVVKPLGIDEGGNLCELDPRSANHDDENSD